MPLMTVMSHTTLFQANDLTTHLTAVCKVQIKAEAAIWSAISHQVLLTGKKFVTFETGKVSHVPAATFCFGTFIPKYYLKHIKTTIYIHNKKFSQFPLLLLLF